MGCKTCDHTMQRVAAIGVFWCPQCGSLKREFFDGDHPEHEEPIIVHRALTFCDAARVCIADKLGSVEVRLLSPVSTPDRTMRALDRCEVALRECCLAPREGMGRCAAGAAIPPSAAGHGAIVALLPE